MLPRLLVLCQLLLSVVAVNYLYEETVWTRHTWPDFLLSFPSQKVLDSLTRSTDFDSASDLGPSSQSSYIDIAGTVFAYDDALPDEVLVLLAEMVKCKACKLLTNGTWQLVTNWLHKAGSKMSEAQLVEHMQAMCEITVPRDLLQDWAIIQAEGPLTGVELPPGLPPAMVQTFMLQARQPNGSPAAYEHMAVQQACSQLLSNQTSPEKSAPVLPALLEALKIGLDSYQSIREDLLRTNEEGGKSLDAAPTQSSCLDLHEKCPFWAATGECEKNVNYMIGFTNDAGLYHDGHCKLSCGLCLLQAPSGLDAEGDAELAKAGSRLQLETSQAACRATGACASPKAPSTRPGADAEDASPPASTPAAAPQGNQQQEGQAVQQATKVAAQRSIKQSLGSLGREPSPAPAPHLLSPAERHLANTLQDQCFYSLQGWWSYEVCFMSHINQFHADQGRLVDAHSLGGYSYDTTAILSTTEPLPLEAADLLPGMFESPAATSQYYTHGRKCEVTEFDEHFHDPEEFVMLRSTELRLACSPDENAHMIVREPAQCVYIIVLYLPSLCELPGSQHAQAANIPSHVDL